MGRAAGIDLGTAHSVIAVLDGGKPSVIGNAQGSRVKRCPGTDWTATIEGARFTPQQISARIMRKLREDAEASLAKAGLGEAGLGEQITEAVLAVPACFTSAQRQAMRVAGAMAGFTVPRLISDSTAAGIASHRMMERDGRILVADLGAGSLSVSLLHAEDGLVHVEAVGGDGFLGGENWDWRIADWLAEDLRSSHGIDLTRDRAAAWRLREAAERAKIELSRESQARILLLDIAESADGAVSLDRLLTRPGFAGYLTGDLALRCRDLVERVMRDANVTAGDVDHVVLAGGASRMPAIADLIRSLTGCEADASACPPELVALGAGLAAGAVTGEVKDIMLLDVAPLSVGVATAGGKFRRIIRRNTTLPARRTVTFGTVTDDQRVLRFEVYEGEHAIAADNETVCVVDVPGIEPARSRGTPVKVTFEIDRHGVVTVYAHAPRAEGQRVPAIPAATAPPVLCPVSLPRTKVVLLGERSAGKTALAAALRGEDFSSRLATHGIEVSSLTLKHPDSGEPVTLRLWDVSGQPAFRPARPLFFSPDALYLVVWDARAGLDGGEVTGWLNLIRLRAGGSARIIVVATHADAKEPDSESLQTLRKQFSGLLAECWSADCESGRGIAGLKHAIAAEAAGADHQVTEVLPDTWARARDAILARAAGEPVISYQEFAGICARHAVPAAHARTLATLMHRLGQVAYHGDGGAVVVLDPGWVSQAVAYVLGDGATAATGVLEHARLPSIWESLPSREPLRGTPDFASGHDPGGVLWFMTELGLCYPVGDGQRSQLAPLIPAARPAGLPWLPGTPLAGGLLRMTVTLVLGEAVAGLIAELPAWLAGAGAGTRWQTGVFLRRPDPARADALIELSEGTRLTIEVRALSPGSFLSDLREAIAQHLERRWSGLGWEEHIPCPACYLTGRAGSFPVGILHAARWQGATTVTCTECAAEHPVADVLAPAGG